jgi:TolB-like protein/class 3 adenylate cyclase/pimeloyl-ACP methyl ester carboxylesterase
LTSKRVERRLAAILAADVAGYSRLMGADEEGTLAAIGLVRRETVDPRISAYGGRIVKTTGDGLLLEFPSVVQAVRCAVEVQQAMVERNQNIPEHRQIRFRVGINVGDIIIEEDDIFGDGVNVAARLEQIASPGGITISGRVYEDVRDRLAIGLQDGGEQQLKNITRPVQVWHWLGNANRLPDPPDSSQTTFEFDWKQQRIEYCRTPDGVRLAYATIGEGPPLVKTGSFLSHLQYDHPLWGPAWVGLASKYKFVRYDPRGNGLSDWDVAELSPDAAVSDLETVVNAIGLKRFALMGFSEGCATSISYAVRHPDRVSHLILYAGFAQGTLKKTENSAGREQILALATLMRSPGWSSSNPAIRQIWSTRLLPDMSKEQAEALDRLVQNVCTGELAARYLLATPAEIDVRGLLPQLRVPTLVFHVRDDAMVPISSGREMAAEIPGARFVSLPGRNHIPVPGDPAGERFLEEMEHFFKENADQPVRPTVSKPSPSSFNSTAPLPLPDKPSIAVLPFQNMSGDPEQEYFADGIVEDIITALARFKSLFVIARNSSFTYKGNAVDIKKVGRELGVRYVLEGSVRKAGARVRVTGQLVDTSTGGHIWADKLDRELNDIFALQDEITEAVAAVIEPNITRAEIERAARPRPDNLTAYDYYLRALPRYYSMTEEGFTDALQLCSRALEVDPRYSAAMRLAADMHGLRPAQGWSKDVKSDYADAMRFGRRALEIDDADPDTLAMFGRGTAAFTNDYDAAKEMVDRAVALNPNSARAWSERGWTYRYMKVADEAFVSFERAIRLSPVDPRLYDTLTGVASTLIVLGRDDEAAERARKALALNPRFTSAHRCLAAALAYLGRRAAAQEAANVLLEIEPSFRINAWANYGGQWQGQRFLDGLRLAGLPE